MGLSEFALIKRYFSGVSKPHSDVELGIGDDAALVNVPSDQSLAMSLDTLVSGVHFPENCRAEDIAWKALAVNLSDMAAMAATPRWMLLGLTLPYADESWMDGFSAGLNQIANEYGVQLIGGDVTHGPLTISVQINGLVPHGQALTRSGAKAGDLIYVTGQLGDAGLGLQIAQGSNTIELSANRREYFLQRLNRPQPRIEVGLAIRGLASAAIDISDGLLADLEHVLESSSAAASINLEQIPAAAEMQLMDDGWLLALASGDDYELCFTISPENVAELEQRLRKISCPYCCIGNIQPGKGLRLFDHDIEINVKDLKGYLHFG